VCSAVRIFCVKTGKNLQNLNYHNDLIYLIAFNEDSSHIISVCADKRIRVFDNKSVPEPDIKRQIVQTSQQHTDQVTTFVVSSDRSTMVTSGKGKEIRVWDLNSGSLVSTLYKHLSSVPYISISNDDQLLLSASQDQVLVLWDLKTFTPLTEFKSPNDVFLSACFWQKHAFVLAGGNDGIRVWDFEKRKQIGCLQNSKTRADSLAFTLDEKFVVSASGEMTSHRVCRDGEKVLAQFLFFVWDFKGFREKLGLS
jgi:WD40 repeat protein